MYKAIYICDHCGKELDEMKDYPDTEFDNFFDIFRADLCTKCFHELNNIVLRYVNKEKDGQGEN